MDEEKTTNRAQLWPLAFPTQHCFHLRWWVVLASETLLGDLFHGTAWIWDICCPFYTGLLIQGGTLMVSGSCQVAWGYIAVMGADKTAWTFEGRRIRTGGIPGLYLPHLLHPQSIDVSNHILWELGLWGDTYTNWLFFILRPLFLESPYGIHLLGAICPKVSIKTWMQNKWSAATSQSVRHHFVFSWIRSM